MDELNLKIKKEEEAEFKKVKEKRMKILNRDTPMSAEEINENLDMIMSLLLTPKTMGKIKYTIDLRRIKTEILHFTTYLTVLRKMISRIPTECKYYFVIIRDYKRCFMAIRKVIVRTRKEYFEAEENLGMLKTKYSRIFLNIAKKFVRPKARQLFYFLDRRIPMDMLFLEILIFKEKMRDPHFKEDPINQMKNTEVLEFVADVRHVCENIKNMVYGYISNVAIIKDIFVTSEEFFAKFEEFDLQHKEYYNLVKKELDDEEFNHRIGIEIDKIEEEKKKEQHWIKEEVFEDTGSVSIDISKELEELATPSMMTMATSDLQDTSKASNSNIVIPEELGICYSL